MSVKININTKDSNLTKKMRVLLVEKIGSRTNKLLKGFKKEGENVADVKVEKGSRWGYKISFSMWLPKKTHIFAKVKDKNFMRAVHETRDLVERQIKDYKEKIRKR